RCCASKPREWSIPSRSRPGRSGPACRLSSPADRKYPGAGAVEPSAGRDPGGRARNVHGLAGPNKNDFVMHIHILGICGTFMGGLAALAREAGHRVTGCDAGVYPPMSDQLRALGIDLIEGFGTEQLALKPDVWVVGNVVSRARQPDGTPRYPLMEAILDQGLPYHS